MVKGIAESKVASLMQNTDGVEGLLCSQCGSFYAIQRLFLQSLMRRENITMSLEVAWLSIARRSNGRSVFLLLTA